MHAYYNLDFLLYFRGMDANPNLIISEAHDSHQSCSIEDYDVVIRNPQNHLHVTPNESTSAGFVETQTCADAQVYRQSLCSGNIESIESRSEAAKFGHKKRVSESETLSLSGGDEWARTTDSRIFSPMLYQLSYITALTRHKSKNNC